MPVLPLAIVAIVAFSIYTLTQSWSNDTVVHRAHGLLQRAKANPPDADELLVACCAECERAAARNPHDVFLLRIWGGALLCRARRTQSDNADSLFVQAEEKYLAALESRPDDLKLSLDLLWVLWERADDHTGPVALDLLKRICGECERLLILYSRESSLLDFWGGALASMGNRTNMPEADRLYAAAEEKYTAALDAKPTDQSIKGSLGILLWRRARRRSGAEASDLLARSSEWLDSALRVNPADPRALSARAWVLFSRSRWQPGEETDRLLSQASAQLIASPDPQLRQAAGVVLWAQGQLEPARQKLVEAEMHEPGSAAYNLACVCAQLGDESECRRWLERSREPGILVSREQMSVEQELAAVRDLPWFRELLS